MSLNHAAWLSAGISDNGNPTGLTEFMEALGADERKRVRIPIPRNRISFRKSSLMYTLP
jgi:hypothetical protein